MCAPGERSPATLGGRAWFFSDQPHGDLSGGLARISPGRRAVDCLRGLSREQAPSRDLSVLATLDTSLMPNLTIVGKHGSQLA